MIPQPNRLKAEDVRRACQVYFQRTKDEMLSRSRKRRVSRPRQFAMTLTRDLTDLSLPFIGQVYGGLDHTTVLHAVRRINQLATDHPHKHGHDLETIKLCLLTYKAQKQLPEVYGYAQEAMDAFSIAAIMHGPSLDREHQIFPRRVGHTVIQSKEAFIRKHPSKSLYFRLKNTEP